VDSPSIGGDSVAITVVDPRHLLPGAHLPHRIEVSRNFSLRVNHPYSKSVGIGIRVDSYKGQKARLSTDSQTSPHFSRVRDSRKEHEPRRVNTTILESSIKLSRYEKENLSRYTRAIGVQS
jgi:hypothetical protein